MNTGTQAPSPSAHERKRKKKKEAQSVRNPELPTTIGCVYPCGPACPWPAMHLQTFYTTMTYHHPWPAMHLQRPSAIPYHTIPCYTIPYHTIPYHIMVVATVDITARGICLVLALFEPQHHTIPAGVHLIAVQFRAGRACVSRCQAHKKEARGRLQEHGHIPKDINIEIYQNR